MWMQDHFVSLSTIIVQGDDGPNPGGPNPGGPDPGGAGGAGGGGTGTPAGAGATGSTFDSLLPLIFVLFFVVIIWSLFRQRRETKKRDALIGSIRKRDQVQTIGGIIGRVVDLQSDRVVLKVDESSNTRMTFARSAIQQKLADDGTGVEESSLAEAE